MRSKSPIIPTVLSCTLSEFQDKVNFAGQVGNSVHLDFVDKSYANASLSIDRWPKLEIEYAEAHLMVDDPEKYFFELKEKGICRAIVQIEAVSDLNKLAEAARQLDLLLGFAISLDTDLNKLRLFWEVGNYFQVMGVPVGRGGQQQDPSAVLAVSYLRKAFPHSLTITFDGGVRRDNIVQLAKAGVDFYLCGSAIFSGRDWQGNYQSLVEAVTNV